MDRGAWRAYSPWGPKESDMTEQLTHTPYNRAFPFCLIASVIW